MVEHRLLLGVPPIVYWVLLTISLIRSRKDVPLRIHLPLCLACMVWLVLLPLPIETAMLRHVRSTASAIFFAGWLCAGYILVMFGLIYDGNALWSIALGFRRRRRGWIFHFCLASCGLLGGHVFFLLLYLKGMRSLGLLVDGQPQW